MQFGRGGIILFVVLERSPILLAVLERRSILLGKFGRRLLIKLFYWCGLNKCNAELAKISNKDCLFRYLKNEPEFVRDSNSCLNRLMLEIERHLNTPM